MLQAKGHRAPYEVCNEIIWYLLIFYYYCQLSDISVICAPDMCIGSTTLSTLHDKSFDYQYIPECPGSVNRRERKEEVR